MKLGGIRIKPQALRGITDKLSDALLFLASSEQLQSLADTVAIGESHDDLPALLQQGCESGLLEMAITRQSVDDAALLHDDE